jgi:hypothetical protein
MSRTAVVDGSRPRRCRNETFYDTRGHGRGIAEHHYNPVGRIQGLQAEPQRLRHSTRPTLTHDRFSAAEANTGLNQICACTKDDDDPVDGRHTAHRANRVFQQRATAEFLHQL